MAKTSTMKSFKNVSVYHLIGALGVTNQADSDENPNLPNYSWEAAKGFIDEWVANEIDENEVDPEQVKDDIQEAVSTAVEENVSRSMFMKVLNAVEYAIGQALDRANVPYDITTNEKKGTLTIAVDRKAIMRAWAEETEGQGMVSWDPSLTANNIENATVLVNILRHRDEVYGGSMKRDYDSSFNSQSEPDTGSYSELSKIARKAYVQGSITRSRVRRSGK